MAIAERKRSGIYRGPPRLVSDEMVEIIVGLSRRGWSLRAIATLLGLEGRPAPRGGPWRHRGATRLSVFIRWDHPGEGRGDASFSAGILAR